MSSSKKIRNCAFGYKCNMKWEDLERIEGYSNRRNCTSCSRYVYLVDSIPTLLDALNENKCVAILEPLELPNENIPSIEPLLGDLCVTDVEAALFKDKK